MKDTHFPHILLLLTIIRFSPTTGGFFLAPAEGCNKRGPSGLKVNLVDKECVYGKTEGGQQFYGSYPSLLNVTFFF